MADATEDDQLVRSDALDWLWQARVQRVDAPDPRLFAFTLYAQREKQVLLLALEPGRRGLGSATARPLGQPASAFVQRLRGALEGARLTRASWLAPSADASTAAALELCFARADATPRLIADFDAQAPNLFLLDAAGQIAGAADERARLRRFPHGVSGYAPSGRGGIALVTSPEQAAQAGQRLLVNDQERSAQALRTRAKALASAALRRAQRKLEAIRGDLARAAEAPALRREANLLLCNLREVPAGAACARLLDQGVEPAEWLDVQLDPALSAQQNADRKFTRARRLERGTGIGSARLSATSAEVDALSAFLASIEESTPETLAEDARSLGLALGAGASAPGPRRARAPQARLPYRCFEASGGALVLVGKSAADNDALTLTVARPQDLWLHARSVEGAHVVVPRDRKGEVAPELLLDAAHLAAHFSAARGETLTEVQHTERRYVRKAKGAAPGSVRIDRERVLLLRLEPERLRRLLAAERTDHAR
jgi:predicted ribosome quality control (RQC) complex YloA/Tae2 family protein